ncbi:MAG: hypothetical protein SFW67_25765 [Myxococcaceae bacterium]|nr:hypothetical protein [Myxococcaceae bacterium]
MALAFACGLVACARVPPKTSLDAEPVRLLNAFFGLDDAIPDSASGICLEAPGSDGMPVTFSHRLSVQPAPGAFQVTTRSGATKTPLCANTRPAIARSENHTVLLLGDLGSVDDPPVTVTVVGDLTFETGASAKGASVAVTGLEAGPTLVLALGYAPGAIDTDCPASTKQLVMVVWAGGVVAAPGIDADARRVAYRVSTSAGVITPFALGDVDDQDNYEHLCLDDATPAERVEMGPGVLIDPRADVNPATQVSVSR